MKIISLQFKNIHSLRGEHTVRFDKPPLQGAGLILITGPTGAGKSTLLDVISLALFNQIPRLPDISKKMVGDLNSIMTHHSKEAWASVTYESKGQRYVSKWSIEVNRNGNLNDYHMEIWHENGQQILDLKKSEVPQKNAELIGLNYQQFVKSIVLSQGEFAQFLKAKHEDRAELLEKITGTDIYRSLGKKAYEKHKEVRQQFAAIHDLIQQLPSTSNEEFEIMQAKILSIDQQLISLHQSTEQLISWVYQIEQYQKKKGSVAETSLQLVEWQTKSLELQIEKNKLTQHESLLSISGELSLIRSAINEKEQLVVEVNDLDNKIASVTHERKQLEQNLSSKLQISWDATAIKEKLFSIRQDMNRLDVEIQRLRAFGDQLRNQTEDLTSKLPVSLKKWQESKIAPAQALMALSQLRKEANEKIGQCSSDINTIRQQLTEDQNTKSNFQELKFLLLKINEADLEILHLKKEIDSELEQFTRIQKDIESHQQVVISTSAQVSQLRSDQEQRMRQIDLNEWRSRLQADQPCPLCGSLSHPYCDQHLVFDIGNLEVEARLKEQELKQVELLLQKSQNQAAAAQTKIQLHQKQLAKSEEEKIKTGQTIASHSTEELTILVIEQKMQQLEVDIMTRQKAVQGLETLLQIAPLEKLFTDLDDTLNTFLKVKKERETTLPTAAQWESWQKDLDRTLMLMQDEVNIREKVLAMKDRITKREKESEKLISQIGPRLQELGLSDHATALDTLLEPSVYEQIKAAVISHEQKGATLSNTLQVLNKELSVLEATIPENADGNLYRMELAVKKSEATELAEKRGGIQEQIKQWHQFKEQANHLEVEKKNIEKSLRKFEMLNQLIGDSMGKQYANFAQELTMQQIILLANRRLSTLSDRYVLVSSGEESRSDLFVRDLYLGGIERSVKTLSGGETFILSLALALSLSDLASRNVKLDCLFIDEGFGTLDVDTLDTVISTLERLQEESDKTIAIISHVDSLKERINSQIRLIRDASGLSSLQIV
ncbi:MAG: AAA family ATPase [Saprospiraceae bacterium]|nr:AAA family ATPase [Saprospiraceae bacterium]